MSMGDLLANRRIQLALGAAVMVLIGVIIGLIISPSGQGGSLGDRVIITTGSGSVITEELPLTVAEATAAGWKNVQVRCFTGMGRYFEKVDAQGQPGPHMLIYNNDNELIGTYIVSTVEMAAPPWEHMEEGLIGVSSYEFPHWSLPVFFKDPEFACGPANAGGIE